MCRSCSGTMIRKLNILVNVKDFRDLIKNSRSLSSYVYIKGSRWNCSSLDLYESCCYSICT